MELAYALQQKKELVIDGNFKKTLKFPPRPPIGIYKTEEQMVTVIIRNIEPGKDHGEIVNMFKMRRMVDTYTKMGYDVIVIYGGQK